MEKIIEQSLKDLVDIIVGNNRNPNKHKIVFPSYQHGNKKGVRYSEQELKQVFLCNLESDGNYCYSVETPTKYYYNISNAKAAQQPPQVSTIRIPNSRSGNVDVSILDLSLTLFSHIEFKYGSNCAGVDKDFLRLICEFGQCDNYFVHYIVEDINNKYVDVIDKYKDIVNTFSGMQIPNNIIFNLSKVVVYLMFVDTNAKDKNSTILKFTLDDVKNINTPVPIFNPKNLPNGFTIV